MKAPQASLTPDKRFAIADFFERYADVVDNGRFDQWPEFFTSDCLYRVTSRENVEAGLEYGALYCQGIGMVRDRTMALRDVTVFEPRTLRHVLGSPRLEQALDGSIKARTSFVVIEVLADSDPSLFMSGEYLDTIVEADGQLLLKERHCIYDNTRIATSLIHPI